MRDADKLAFVKTLTGVSDYYARPLSTSTIELYWQGLRQYDLESVSKALWQHTQNPDTGQFMPKIADVTKMLQGRTEDQAALAWSKVDIAVRQVGGGEDVAFDDALIHRVLADMGGWARVASTGDEKEWPFVAKEFVNRYRGYRMSGQTPEYPRYLTGTYSAENGAACQQRPLAVRLLGNPQKAEAVIRGGVALLAHAARHQIEDRSRQ